jgi:threonine/homoserine/homoserine lactone efflux protein
MSTALLSDALPSLPTFLAFSGAALLVALTPGPDMTLFLARTIAGGRRLGFAAMFGAASGLIVHAVLAAVGLSALLAASEAAFVVLKVVGAAYLVWLAVQALRHGSALRIEPAHVPAQSVMQTFLTGLGINLTNPKIIMFFVTFLPQFVSPADPHAAAKLLFLGLWFIAIGVPVCSLIILGAERFTARMKRSPRLMRTLDYGIAGVMGAFAVRLLLAQR